MSTDKLCSVCFDHEFKYKCPKCSIRTCSLECIKRHKLQNDCDGKIDNTKFVPKKELSDSTLHLNRDYNFLMKLNRDITVNKTDLRANAKNMFKRNNNSYNRNRNNKRLKVPDDPRLDIVQQIYPNPQTVIKRENVLVINLPDGMSRSISNKTGYDKKLQNFTWTIQWIFEGQDLKKDFISYRISENLKLVDAFPVNVLNVELKKEDLKFYLENVITINDKYIQLNGDTSISECLKDTIVLEYPTIHVRLDEIESITLNKAYQMTNDSSESDSDSDSSSDDSSDESNDSDESDDNDSDSDGPPEEHLSKDPNQV